jgi:hypothetical protein
MRDVDSSRMVFTQVPSRVLSGAEAGRLESMPEETKALFEQIANDQPIVLEPTPTP